MTSAGEGLRHVVTRVFVRLRGSKDSRWLDAPAGDCDDAAMRLASRPWSVSIARLALAIFVLLPVVALLAVRGFAGMYGQDSFGYIDYALGPLREALLRPDFPPAWLQPPGYPLVVAGWSLLVGPDGRIGLVVSLVAGCLVPVFTALLATETVGPRLTGRTALLLPLLAGLIAALPGQLWQSSAVAMPDTLSIALATAAAWAACRYVRSGTPGWLLGAAGAMAAAIDTRWIYGLVAVPVAFVAIVGLGRIWRADHGRAVLHALGATLVCAAVLVPVAGPMALAVLHGTSLPFAADFGAYHWDPANALRNTFETPDGRLTYGPTSGAFYLLQAGAPYWFGPMGIFALWGGAWAVRRAGPGAAVLLVGWPLIVLVFLAGSPYQNTRFFLSVMPPVAILIAAGLWRLAVAVDARLPPERRRLVIGGSALAVAAWVVVGAVVAGRFTDAFIDRQSRDLAAIRGLEARIPVGARVISMGPTGVFVYDGLADVVELYDLTPDGAIALLADGRPSYLVVDPDAIGGQWAGRRPALTVEAIRSRFGVSPVAAEGIWNLARIGP